MFAVTPLLQPEQRDAYLRELVHDLIVIAKNAGLGRKEYDRILIQAARQLEDPDEGKETLEAVQQMGSQDPAYKGRRNITETWS